MTGNEKQVTEFWLNYLQAMHDDSETNREQPEAWGFGDSPEMADELGQLVLDGTKTATCSLLWEYEAEEESHPEEGDLAIVLDGRDFPLCIIEITEVRFRAYDQVDAQFAFDEGEGDRSLAYWRAVHWHFFSRACEKIGLQVSEDMPLICERFRVIYPRIK